MSEVRVDQIHAKHRTWFTRVRCADVQYQLYRPKGLPGKVTLRLGEFVRGNRGGCHFREHEIDTRVFDTQAEALAWVAEQHG